MSTIILMIMGLWQRIIYIAVTIMEAMEPELKTAGNKSMENGTILTPTERRLLVNVKSMENGTFLEVMAVC